MLDQNDLQAIERLLDGKLSAQKQDIMHDVTQLMTEQKQDIMHDVNLLIENLVIPQFDLLAEGQQSILEKLVPKSRVDELEEEVKFLKVILKLHSEEIANLKKAQ